MPSRVHERLPVGQRVTVNFPDRKALFEMYLKDISRGGVFVHTDEPFELRSHIEIILQVDKEGSLVLRGEVVHVVTAEQAASWGAQAGIGIQFVDLDAAKRDLLESYLDGLRAGLDDELKAAPFDTTMIRQVEEAHRKGDVFAVLGLDLKADSVQAQVASETRRDVLSALLNREGIDEALRKRIIGARLAVERAGAMLCDDLKRAHYLMQGQRLPVAELALLFMRYPSVWKEIGQRWDAAHPTESSSARRIGDLAERAASNKDFASAVKSATLALKQHPFLFELRKKLKDWQRQV